MIRNSELSCLKPPRRTPSSTRQSCPGGSLTETGPAPAPTDTVPGQGPDPVLGLAQVTEEMVIIQAVAIAESRTRVESLEAGKEERMNPMTPDPEKRSLETQRIMNRQFRTAGTIRILFQGGYSN